MNDVERPPAGYPLGLAGRLRTGPNRAAYGQGCEPTVNISGLDFPPPLIAAMRSDRLVVFAGAGISMPAPAGLPDFEGLAGAIAMGTGETRDESEPVDRFLGRLKSKGANVHARAAEVLQDSNPQPSALHSDLLRLYQRPESVRVVTTNFAACLNRRHRVYSIRPQPQQQPRHSPVGPRSTGSSMCTARSHTLTTWCSLTKTSVGHT